MRKAGMNMVSRVMLHFKCRNGSYPRSEVARFPVQDSQTSWSTQFPEYNPPTYESRALKNKPWADPVLDDVNFNPKWNELDGSINRKSHGKRYEIVDGSPRNLIGRTGIEGRGVLGRWGPNHAADPIVTRWKRVDGGVVVNQVTTLPVLQFCAILRRDCNEWAIPGGMVDPGENVSQTLIREFMEETLNSLEHTAEKVERNKSMIKDFFKSGEEIYKGYVDDPRNTDNAWMETVAYNFHDETGEFVGKFSFKAGDDAQNVEWKDIDKNLNLYASHLQFLLAVVQLRNAHW